MILVSIVGDFDSSVLPIFYEFKDDITKHILLYDDFKNDVAKAKNLSRGIKRFVELNAYSFKTLEYKLDEDSMDAIAKCCEYLLSQTDDANDIFINSTDGLASLTAILSHKLLKKGVNFVSYDLYDNEYNVFNKKTLDKHPIENQMNIDEHFMLKGLKTQKSEIKKLADSYEIEIKKLFENLSDEYDSFLKFDAGSKIVNEIPKRYKNIKKIFITMGLGSFHAKDSAVTGSLFEAYIYNLLKRLKFDDIEVGIKVSREYKTTSIENEFDILIMKNNHLHMIECKYRNRIDLEQLIYKYIALSSIIDEDAKMIIVSKKAQLYNSEIDKNQNKARVQKRGKLSNIEVVGAVHKNPSKFMLMTKKYLLL